MHFFLSKIKVHKASIIGFKATESYWLLTKLSIDLNVYAYIILTSLLCADWLLVQFSLTGFILDHWYYSVHYPVFSLWIYVIFYDLYYILLWTSYPTVIKQMFLLYRSIFGEETWKQLQFLLSVFPDWSSFTVKSLKVSDPLASTGLLMQTMAHDWYHKTRYYRGKFH